jgi:Chaperone of endosialidase
MGKPDAPTPPNPTATAAAQTGTNVSTAVANAFLQNTGQNTPDGSLRYDVTGNYGWTDPSTGQTYQIPTFTSTQSLSPQAQAIKAQTDATKMNLAGMGNAQSARVSSLLSTPFDPSGSAPAGGNAQGILGVPQAATSFDQGAPIQTSFGDAGDITRSYGAGDFSQDRQNVEDSLMQRLNPQLDRQRAQIQQQLADQGIRYGSQAYTSAMDDYNRQTNDARLAVVGQAGQEQQRMMDMAAQRAGFQNSAEQQAYDQAMGRGTFANQAAGQQFQQNSAAATFQNAGLAQQLAQQQSGFNAQNAQRNQYMQEQYQQRNQPLNEISALMSGSQVQQPNWLNSPTSQIPTTDFAGITNQNFQNQMGVYNTQNQNWQQLMGGVLGLGAGAMKLSDERDKKNIAKVGSVFSTHVADVDRDELPIYTYNYKDDPSGAQHIGPMAQDVEKVDPGAVKNVRGRKMINTQRVMGNILRAA